MTSLGFIAPPPKILGPPLNLAPPPNLIFCSRSPQLIWPEIFSPPLPPKIGGRNCYHAYPLIPTHMLILNTFGF